MATKKASKKEQELYAKYRGMLEQANIPGLEPHPLGKWLQHYRAQQRRLEAQKRREASAQAK